MKDTVSIVILTYNNLHKVEKCLSSLLPVLDREDILECLILDNGSDADTVECVRQFQDSHSKARAIFSKENRGCAGGRKDLLQRVRGKKILILDSDVVITSGDFIDKLSSALEKPGVGIVGCAGALVNNYGVDFNLLPENYDGPADAVVGYCQLFRKTVLEAGCEIDEYYNPYGEEDFDFSLQIKEKLGLISYKVSREDFGLTHDCSETNRTDRKKREKNLRYLFLKFGIYKKGMLGYISFALRSRHLFKWIDRKIGMGGILLRKFLSFV